MDTQEILAKPSGISLAQHSQDVVDEGVSITKAHPFVCAKYRGRTGKGLETRLEVACRLHDSGKKHPAWQSACQKDYENYIEWKAIHGGSFRDYSFYAGARAGENLRRAKLRHEFQSLVCEERKNLPLAIQAAIGAHHAKLGFRHAGRWLSEGAEKFWTAFRKEANRISEDFDFTGVVNKHYEFAGVRGLVQLADHRASAIEDGQPVPQFTPFKYTFPHAEKRNVQEIIEKHWTDELLLVRAPTGAGKTDAALLWAGKQIESGKADRAVIAMPTRFTSNALALNIMESLSNTGLYHSSAWFTRHHEPVKHGRVTRDSALKIHEFARLLETPVTVCTIDHLLITLTLTREDHHLIAFNLAHSCLVIDEADFYDDFTQANILVLLEFLAILKVPVLLMSASLPQAAVKLYGHTGYSPSEIREDVSDIDRPRFKIQSILQDESTTGIEELLSACIRKQSAIIYANTVDRAIRFYQWFEKRKVDVTLYHSRFTEPDKKRKEEELLAKLGFDAWRAGKAHGIAVLTQIGEMSINISSNFMISDVCPIDRLTQRAGRLCRFEKGKLGDLHVVIPQKDGQLYPAPYGHYDRQTRAWVPAPALVATKQNISTRNYSAGDLVALINEVYNEFEFSSSALDNARSLKEYFVANWLVTSQENSDIDDTEVNFWSSRNIAPQQTVYTRLPDRVYFNNYLDLQEWKIQHSVEIPVYVTEQAVAASELGRRELFLKDEAKTVLVLEREELYSYETGLVFNAAAEDKVPKR